MLGSGMGASTDFKCVESVQNSIAAAAASNAQSPGHQAVIQSICSVHAPSTSAALLQHRGVGDRWPFPSTEGLVLPESHAWPGAGGTEATQ